VAKLRIEILKRQLNKTTLFTRGSNKMLVTVVYLKLILLF